ncbi:trafficking protein particle complex subunit 11 [Ischnura elegans]|uniref:trafficking protein particle complex subunit 11 n=1 Tax=Ischnura elegans TaxID=197161 RepID=UPI001ED89F34|nr:trafficking protein particle complex subunit 11 [Ischnura elegans]
MSPTPDSHDLPQELCAPALAPIGFTGLDTLNNAVHRAVWDAFSNARTPERAPISFMLLSPDQEFPPMKTKRNSYEWYVPKGILKTNWMDKHLKKLPAVVVIFYDLDWDDPLWNEKKQECASRVQSVRAALEGRGCRIAVTLLQQASTALPSGEDVMAIERGNALRTACALNAKSLFVLPHGDHLHGYILRLEKAFFELSQTYYHQKIKGVRSHLDQLNRTSHHYLFVRHQFKMGFYSELKQDYSLAHKHYMKAYGHLLELRILENNSSEIRTVGGYINYILCRLMFLHLNFYREAITQFRNHIDQFRTRMFGPRELEFEHHAWMCSQFGTFGDLFDEAVRRGLPGIQVQHPGYYYQQAALHAVERKKSCMELCKDVEPSPPNVDPFAGWPQPDFYGQRPWRVGKAVGDPSDPAKEKEGILALQAREKAVNHSSLIISILGSAISQFKTYNCPRMRRHLVIQMADEYYSFQDYTKALALLGHVLWEHRSERWWLLLTHALSRALVCAYLTASIQEFIALSIEALGPNVLLSQTRKASIFSNLCKVVKRVSPDLDAEVDVVPVSAKESAKHLWDAAAIANNVPLVPVDMVGGGMASLAECRARFSAPSLRLDEQAKVEVYVRSLCEQPVSFYRLSVVINGPAQGPIHVVVAETGSAGETDGSASNLSFECGEVKLFTATFPLDSRDIGKTIQISSTSLQFGQDSERFIILRYLAVGAGESFTPNTCPELQNFRSSPVGKIRYDDVRPLGSAVVLPRCPRLSVHTSFICDPPILVGEFFPVRVELASHGEERRLNSLVLNVQVAGDPVSASGATNDAGKDATLLHPQSQKTIISTTPTYLQQSSDLQLVLISNSSKSQSLGSEVIRTEFYVSALCPGKREISIKALYGFEGEDESEREEAETKLVLEALDPLSVSVQILSLGRLDTLSSTLLGEPFIFVPRITSHAHCTLRITSSYFNLAENVKAVGVGEGFVKGNQMCGLELGPKEGATEALVARIGGGTTSPGRDDLSSPTASTTMATGTFSVCWVRASKSPSPGKEPGSGLVKDGADGSVGDSSATSPLMPTETSVPLPRVRVDWTPLLIEAELPAHGWTRTAMPVLYRIHNCTHGLLRLQLSMEANDAFMFAGHIQTPLCILPHSVDTFTFNLYPLLSGLVALPRLRLSVQGGRGSGGDDDGGGDSSRQGDGDASKAVQIGGDGFAHWRDSHATRQSQLRDLLDRSLPTHVYIMPQAKGKAASLPST